MEELGVDVDKVLAAVLAAVLAMAFAEFLVFRVWFRPPEGTTELYVVSEDGIAAFPSAVREGEVFRVVVEVRNLEGESCDYALVALLEHGGRVDVLGYRRITLDDRECWREVFEVVAPGEDFKLSFRLYKEPELDLSRVFESEPYREVHLVLSVKACCS